MKKLILIGMMLCLSGCAADFGDREGKPTERTEALTETGESASEKLTTESDPTEDSEDEHTKWATEAENKEPWVSIVPSGMTLESRINTPEGYTRTTCTEGSLAAFLRGYSMKEDGAPVLLYNGEQKGNQRAHAAVFALPIEEENLQQCADSVMRVYAEYCWQMGCPEKLKFHFTNGFLTEYSNWREGDRIKMDGKQVYWVESTGYDDSYASFQAYMRMVFSYAGTLSMDTYESSPIGLDEVQVGDVFLKGGSPGHVVMVVDMCEDEKGKKAFLLGQGYMPAQEFHVIKNPAHADDPWYYEDEVTYPFQTAEYTFSEGSLKRLSYVEWVVR